MTIQTDQYRRLVFDLVERSSDDEIPVVVSSDAVVEVSDGPEILVHDAEAIDLSRAPLPIIASHRSNQVNVGIVDRLRIENGKLRGVAKFGSRPEAAAYRQDVLDGIVRSVSAGYRRVKATVRKDGVLVTTRWMPFHVAMVAEPADAVAGFFRASSDKADAVEITDESGNGVVISARRAVVDGLLKQEVTTVTTETTAKGGEGDGEIVNVVPMKEAQKRAVQRAAVDARKAEKQRLAEINELFEASRFQGDAYDDLRRRCIDEDSTVEQARAALLSLINSDPQAEVEPTAVRKAPDESAKPKARDPFIQVGRTDGEKLAEGMQRALEFRAGLLSAEDARKEQGSNEFVGMTLVDMIRNWGSRNGIRVTDTPYQMIGRVLSEGRRSVIGLGTSDFTGIVANVAGKSLLAGWEENPSTYRQWVRIGSVNDFRRVSRTGLSGMDLLDAVPESGEYTYGDASDRTEYLQAIKYGKLFSISREALLADDVNAFTTIPRKMGRAADMTINKKVYEVILGSNGAGPTLNQDSTALFDTSTHKNYTTSSGGAPTVARLEVGRAAMAVQTDPNNGLPLNIVPKYLIVPAALYSTSRVLVASEKDPVGATSAGGGATQPNPFYNALTVIQEPYLDLQTASSRKGNTAWYLVADQNMYDTVEVAFVGGQSTPYLESRDGWNVDGVEYKVRIEAGVAVLDFRAMYRNDGD